MEQRNQLGPFILEIQKHLLKKLGLKEVPKHNGKNDIRVDGAQLCSYCKRPYNEHPYDFNLIYERRPVFRLDCGGQRLKL